jgi:putative transposase
MLLLLKPCSFFFRNKKNFCTVTVASVIFFSVAEFAVKMLAGAHPRIPKLGWVRMRESLTFCRQHHVGNSKPCGRALVYQHQRGCARFTCAPVENQGAAGADPGVSALATLSTGEPPIVGPKAHTAMLKRLRRLRRLSRCLSRKQNSSQDCKEPKVNLATLHARISNIRN